MPEPPKIFMRLQSTRRSTLLTGQAAPGATVGR